MILNAGNIDLISSLFMRYMRTRTYHLESWKTSRFVLIGLPGGRILSTYGHAKSIHAPRNRTHTDMIRCYLRWDMKFRVQRYFRSSDLAPEMRLLRASYLLRPVITVHLLHLCTPSSHPGATSGHSFGVQGHIGATCSISKR